MSVPGADASAAAAPAGGPATGKKKKLGKKERQRLKAIADGTYVAPVLPQKQPPKAKQARTAVQRRDGAQFAHEVHQGGVDHHRFAGDVRAVPGPHEQDPRVGVLGCLGRLATAAADARWFERDRAALEALARKTTEMVLASVDVGSSPADDASANAVMGARELANVAHGLAKCGAARGGTAETFSSNDASTPSRAAPPSRRAFGERDALPRTNGFILSRTHDRRSAEKDVDENENASSDPTRALIAALAKALTVRARECNALEAANAAWASASSGEKATPSCTRRWRSSRGASRKRRDEPQGTRERRVGLLRRPRGNAEKAGEGWRLKNLKNDGENDDERDAATNASINVSFAEDMARTVETLASSAANRLASFDARGVCVLTCALAKANAGAPAGSDERRVPNAFAKATRLLAAETTSRCIAIRRGGCLREARHPRGFQRVAASSQGVRQPGLLRRGSLRGARARLDGDVRARRLRRAGAGERRLGARQGERRRRGGPERPVFRRRARADATRRRQRRSISI